MKNIKFKLLIIKGDAELESKINEFIKDKFVINVKVQIITGFRNQTHQVYITYK